MNGYGSDEASTDTSFNDSFRDDSEMISIMFSFVISNPKSFTPYRATYPWWLRAHVEENQSVRFVRSKLE